MTRAWPRALAVSGGWGNATVLAVLRSSMASGKWWGFPDPNVPNIPFLILF